MELRSLASGSSGNACLVRNGGEAILVDAGISARRLETMILAEGLNPQSLLGVVLTHEHSDHSRGITQLSALFGLPIYASAGTFRALGSPPNLDWRRLEGGKITSIGSIDVVPVQIPHDAAEPFVYRFESDQTSAAIATDFGSATDALDEAFRDLDVLVLEANHDESWLWKGGYPWSSRSAWRAIMGISPTTRPVESWLAWAHERPVRCGSHTSANRTTPQSMRFGLSAQR